MWEGPMYRMSWIKYCNTRTLRYSHKEVCAKLGAAGFLVKIDPPATMIAYIEIETAEQRKRATEVLNLISRDFPHLFEKVQQS